MVILVDMDDVLADFDGEFLKKWREEYPDKFYIPLDKRKSFYIKEEYPEELLGLVTGLYYKEGFARSLPEIQGATEGIKKLKEKGHDVFICTSPLMQYRFCVREKYEWIEEHLGYDWTLRLILTRDKTLIQGDILIDDKPEITGARKPVWEHVLFEKSYNEYVKGKRRLNWGNMEQVLDEI
ncbi:5'-3'-deoxyribonucleotidase [bacterium]|nr:MAG: 5'-3'-deoxyribonucleotidase [bacterium]